MSQPVHLEPSRRLLFVDAVVPGGQNLSAAVNLRGYVLKGLMFPSDWTTADVSFQAARAESGEYLDVYGDNDQAVVVDVSGSSRYVVLSGYVGTANRGWAEALAGVDFLKVRSGTPAAPVNQVGNKTVTLILGASTK